MDLINLLRSSNFSGDILFIMFLLSILNLNIYSKRDKDKLNPGNTLSPLKSVGNALISTG